MTVITIPKHLAKAGDLVLVPKKEYQALVKTHLSEIKEATFTARQKKVVQEARKRIDAGDFLTVNEIKEKLGIENRQ
jgi:hypothetical protein